MSGVDRPIQGLELTLLPHLGSSFTQSEYTVINVSHSHGPPRLVSIHLSLAANSNTNGLRSRVSNPHKASTGIKVCSTKPGKLCCDHSSMVHYFCEISNLTYDIVRTLPSFLRCRFRCPQPRASTRPCRRHYPLGRGSCGHDASVDDERAVRAARLSGSNNKRWYRIGHWSLRRISDLVDMI
jgi:hypothetical protein